MNNEILPVKGSDPNIINQIVHKSQIFFHVEFFNILINEDELTASLDKVFRVCVIHLAT